MAQYCTAVDVAEILGISAWPSTGAITEATIEKWIRRVEDRVDLITGTSYKKQTATQEYHDYLAVENRADTGVPIYLKKDNVYDFDGTKGDKIEVWNGSTYTDLVATGTEGRGNDYWLDAERGVLYIKQGVTTIVQGVRVTYRYGEYTQVPGYIEDATSLLVAARVAILDGTVAVLQSEGRDVPTEQKVQLWKEEANQLLHSQRGYSAVRVLPGVLR